MEWIWDVAKRHKLPHSWLSSVVEWYIDTEDGSNYATARNGKGRIMRMFRGTEQECQEYIDEQAKPDAELPRLKGDIYDLKQTIKRLTEENERAHSMVHEYGTKLQKINVIMTE